MCVCPAAADERPSTRVHHTAPEGTSNSWASLLHAAKPLIAVVAATTGIALLAQLFFRYITGTAAPMVWAMYAAYPDCAYSIWAMGFIVTGGPYCLAAKDGRQDPDQLFANA